MTIQFDCNWTGRSAAEARREGKEAVLQFDPALQNALMQLWKVSVAHPLPIRPLDVLGSGGLAPPGRPTDAAAALTRSPQRGATYFPAIGGAINIHLIYTPMYTCGIKEGI